MIVWPAEPEFGLSDIVAGPCGVAVGAAWVAVGTGVFVGGAVVGVAVGGTGVLVGSGIGVLVGSGTGVLVGSGMDVLVGSAIEVLVAAALVVAVACAAWTVAVDRLPLLCPGVEVEPACDWEPLVLVELLVTVEAALPLAPVVAVELEPLDVEDWVLLPGAAVEPGGCAWAWPGALVLPGLTVPSLTTSGWAMADAFAAAPFPFRGVAVLADEDGGRVAAGLFAVAALSPEPNPKMA